MAQLEIKTSKILENIKKINDYLGEQKKTWTLVVKVLSGHKPTLEKILYAKEMEHIHSIGDSRISGLKRIKEINPDIQTFYLKPPAIHHASNIIKSADISINTSFDTIQALNEEAIKQDKMHKIIIMIELGELREGIVRENIDEFYDKISQMSNIKIEGLGTNLGCMYGVEPNYDKMIQLCLYKQLIEYKHKINIDLVSGGSSITLPLLPKKRIPEGMNHFRIGETAFLGVSPLNNKKFRNLTTDTFEFYGHIIELEQKDSIPDGVLSEGNVGFTGDDPAQQDLRKTYRAILNFGILDVDVKNLTPKNDTIKFAGTTSDMTVYELLTNKSDTGKPNYKVGDRIRFSLDYMGVARLMSSKFIDKIIK